MADTKISDLTAQTAATIANDDEFVIVDTDAGATERLTASQLITYLTSALPFDVDTVTVTDASYSVANTLQAIFIDDAGDNTDIDITFAAAIPVGTVVIVGVQDSGAVSHTLTLGGSQTFNAAGNTIATFDAADECIAFVGISSTRVLVFANVGAVAFS